MSCSFSFFQLSLHYHYHHHHYRIMYAVNWIQHGPGMLCCTWKIGSPSLVDAHGLHSFACKRAPGRSARHHALNDLIAWEFASAGIPAMREPQCLSHSDGKRPDGLTLIPWQAGNFSCNMACHGRLPVSRFLHSHSGAGRRRGC